MKLKISFSTGFGQNFKSGNIRLVVLYLKIIELLPYASGIRLLSILGQLPSLRCHRFQLLEDVVIESHKICASKRYEKSMQDLTDESIYISIYTLGTLHITLHCR